VFARAPRVGLRRVQVTRRAQGPGPYLSVVKVQSSDGGDPPVPTSFETAPPGNLSTNGRRMDDRSCPNPSVFLIWLDPFSNERWRSRAFAMCDQHGRCLADVCLAERGHPDRTAQRARHHLEHRNPSTNGAWANGRVSGSGAGWDIQQKALRGLPFETRRTGRRYRHDGSSLS